MTVSVSIAKTVYGGDGLGRLGDGRVIFVPGAWTGEQVRAEIVEEKKHFVKARLVDVMDASPDRIAAPKEAVPGMVYAALSPAGEHATKERQLRDFFDRARIPVPEFSFGDASDLPTANYRNKVVYHFAKQRGAWVIGYRTEPSHEIVDVLSDPLARPEINAALPEIRRNLLTLLTTGPQAVRRATEQKENLTVRWTRKTGVKWWIGDAPKDLVLKETTMGLDFEVPAGGFYQMNPEVGEKLVKTVVEEYARGAQEAPDVLDLYCGVGVFGICCLKRATGNARLIGIESGSQAIDFARRNAAALLSSNSKLQLAPSPSNSNSNSKLQLSPSRFFAEQVGRNTRRIPISPRTTVIVDPPREGLEPGVAKWLAASRAPRIFYVSCDPATLVRDLREITRTYDVESVRGFDMFPRTARFETLVVLRKRSA